MKKLIILLAAVASVPFANAQKVSEKEVPAAVKLALQESHPNAKGLKWSKEKGNYEAEFRNSGSETECSVVIEPSGEIFETEMEIKNRELPVKAMEYVAKNYTGQKIKEAAKITDNKGVVTFEVEVKDGDLIFDEKGNFIRQIKKSDKDDQGLSKWKAIGRSVLFLAQISIVITINCNNNSYQI